MRNLKTNQPMTFCPRLGICNGPHDLWMFLLVLSMEGFYTKKNDFLTFILDHPPILIRLKQSMVNLPSVLACQNPSLHLNMLLFVKCYTPCAWDVGEKSVNRRNQDLNLCYWWKQILEKDTYRLLRSHRLYVFVCLRFWGTFLIFALGSVSFVFSLSQWNSLQHKCR